MHVPNETPQTLQDIADAIGADAAMKLVESWPMTRISTTGRRRAVVYVPMTLPESHRLVDILGRDVADRFVRRFGGELLFLPRCTCMRQAERRRAVLEAVAAREPARCIARRHGITERHVRRIAAADIPAKEFTMPAADHAVMNHMALNA